MRIGSNSSKRVAETLGRVGCLLWLCLFCLVGQALGDDEYEWVLVDIRAGHTWQGSADISTDTVNGEFLPADGASGTIDVTSGGYTSDGETCTEHYQFTWSIDGEFRRLPANGSTLPISLNAAASGGPSPLPGGQCPGSNDAGIVGQGSDGVIRPMFMTAEEWDYGLPSTGRSELVSGFSSYYPQTDDFTIEIPPFQGSHSHTAFDFQVGLGNPIASAVFEYAVVYLYVATRKGLDPLTSNLWVDDTIDPSTGGRAEFCVRNNTAAALPVAGELWATSNGQFVVEPNALAAMLAPDEYRCFEIALPPENLRPGNGQVIGYVVGYSSDETLPLDVLLLSNRLWDSAPSGADANYRVPGGFDAVGSVLQILLDR
jgi:hypothetical protein